MTTAKTGRHLAGILPPITTPFDSRGELDLAALARNIERYNASGIVGYVVFGSNGEAVHLTADEQLQVLRVVRQHAAPGLTVVAGINQLSTRGAITAIAQAADVGVDAALVITPYFYKGAMQQDVLRAFFLEVAAASPLPLLVYNVPQNTGVVIEPVTLAELATHPKIVGVKDSSGNFAALAETLRLVPSSWNVLVGNAGILYPALAMGARGAILAVACLAPSACAELYAAVQLGDTARAQALQQQLAPIAHLVTAGLGVSGLKAALDRCGWFGGLPRRPLLPLTPEQLVHLDATLSASGPEICTRDR